MDAPAWLDRFAAAADPGRWAIPFLHHHDGGRHARHVVVGVAVHGDEVGPLPAAVALVEALRSGALTFGGRLSLFVGNPEAVRAGVRALDSDLNRVFLATPPDDREGRRARVLAPVLDTADLFVDLHQTGQPTPEPFYTLPWRPVDERWAGALAGARLWLARPWGQDFSPGTCCADEYVRARGRPGLTLELSRKGLDPATEARAGQVLRRLLRLVDQDAAGAPLEPGPPLTFLQTVHREPLGDPLRRLRPGLHNLQPVAAGEILSPPDGPEITCPVDGLLVFPTYPRRDAAGRALPPLPGELFRVVAPLDRHPSALWPAPPVLD